jgi:hypothetical protein
MTAVRRRSSSADGTDLRAPGDSDRLEIIIACERIPGMRAGRGTRSTLGSKPTAPAPVRSVATTSSSVGVVPMV